MHSGTLEHGAHRTTRDHPRSVARGTQQNFACTRMPLDLVVARDSLEMAFLERARTVDIGGLKVRMITPEDLVIAKLFAGRPRDLEDIRAVLGTLGASMDIRYVRTILGQLDEAEDRAELLPMLERLLEQGAADE